MRTVLQNVSEEIAAEHAGVELDVVCKGVDAKAVEWLVIVELIMTFVSQMLERCQQPPQAIVDSCHNPGLWERVQLRRSVRQACVDCCGLAWLRKVDGLVKASLAVGAGLDADTIKEVVQQVQATE